MVHNPIVDNVYWIHTMVWDNQGSRIISTPCICKKNLPGGMVAMHRLDDEDSSSIVPIHIDRLEDIALTPVELYQR